MKILFWNLKKNSIEKYIADCIDEKDIDVALFSEYDRINFKKLEKLLHNQYKHVIGMGGCDKITLVARNIISVEIKREQDRYVLYTINSDNFRYIISGVHLQDRRSSDSQARIIKIGRIVNDIKNLETTSKCKKTIIIGDFNANPYDDELLGVSAFNAVLFKEEILRSETRKVDGEIYRRFFNPILHFISEETKMYGSFYYNQGSATPIWNCLDQMIVSKALANSVIDMQYLKMIKETSLISRVRPNAKISDHLPLYVELTEE